MRKFRFNQTCARILLSFSILLHAQSSFAEDVDYFNLEPAQLINAQVISASKKLEKVSQIPAAVYIITQENLQRAGVTSIPEALRLAPGVQVARADSNSWAISIRGFNGVLANKILVMIDGRTVYNPLFAGTYWELQDYPLMDIERIEVIRGPGGALWGANAVNGVINIITKDAQNTQGNTVTALAGNEDRGIVSARHGGTFGDDKYYRVYAKYFNRDSFQKPNGQDAHDAWDGQRSGFRMDWGDELTVQGDVYRILTDQINSTPTTISPFALIEEETMNSRGANILARWKKKTENGGLLTTQSYLDYFTRDQILLKDQRMIFDVETQYNFPLGNRQEIVTGAGYRYTADNLGNAPTVTFDPASRSDNLLNFFLQDKITLIPEKWYLTLGSKIEHNDYTGVEIQPNARLQYQMDPTQMLWAAISHAVRTPSRLEHDLNETITVLSGGTHVVLQANDDFHSERLNAYEVGYRKQVNDTFSYDATAFFNDYDDLETAGFLPVSAGILPIEAINGMKAETYGMEIAAEWEMTPDLKLTGSYSYLDMFLHVQNNGGFDLESAEETSPQHQVSVQASWNATDKLSLDGNIYYVSPLEASHVDGYVRADVNVGWKINDRLRLNIVGQNLFDESHREFSTANSLNASEVQRSVFGKLTWAF